MAPNQFWNTFTKRLSSAADLWKRLLVPESQRSIQRPPVDYEPNNQSHPSTNPDQSNVEDHAAISLAIRAEADIDNNVEVLPASQVSVLTSFTAQSGPEMTTSTSGNEAASETSITVDPPLSSTSFDQSFVTTPMPANLSMSTPSPSLPLSDDCSQCFIIFKYVSVYYPPAESSNTDCLKGIETPSPSLPPGLEA